MQTPVVKLIMNNQICQKSTNGTERVDLLVQYTFITVKGIKVINMKSEKLKRASVPCEDLITIYHHHFYL